MTAANLSKAFGMGFRLAHHKLIGWKKLGAKAAPLAQIALDAFLGILCVSHAKRHVHCADVGEQCRPSIDLGHHGATWLYIANKSLDGATQLKGHVADLGLAIGDGLL